MIEFKTSKGTFTVQLFDKQAPITVENILRYVDEGFEVVNIIEGHRDIDELFSSVDANE